MRAQLLVLLFCSVGQLSHAQEPLNLIIVSSSLVELVGSSQCPVFDANYDAAIPAGDLDAVKTELDSWLYYFSSALRNERIAKSLSYAAKFPHKVTGTIASHLLEIVDKDFVKRADCILDDALANGHQAIVDYLVKNFTDDRYRTWALADAIEVNKPGQLEMLLKAGLDPNLGLVSPLHRAVRGGKSEFVGLLLKYGAEIKEDWLGLTPIDYAVAAFSNDDDENTTIHRLYILRRLLRRANAEMITRTVVDLCHLKGETQMKVSSVLKERPLVSLACEQDESAEK